MREKISYIGNALTKIESWWALGSLVTGTGLFAWLGSQWDSLSSQGWPAIIILSLVCASLLTIAIGAAFWLFQIFFGKRKGTILKIPSNASPETITKIEQEFTEKQKKEAKQVRNASFSNEEVVLDGKIFIKCEFNSVTFVYNGGYYEMDDCKTIITSSGIKIRSDILEIVRAIELFTMFTMMDKTEEIDGRGIKSVKIPINIKPDHPNLISGPQQPKDTE